MYGKPSNSKIKILGESTVWISPRNISNKNAMFRALVRCVLYSISTRDAAPVQTPSFLGVGLEIITFASSMADGTVILIPAIRVESYGKVMNTASSVKNRVQGQLQS